MIVDCSLPSAKHLVIILLFNGDASLVLDLSEFGRSFFVHPVLEVATHGPITFTYLPQDIGLVIFLFIGDPESFLFVSPVLSIDIGVDLGLVMVLEPLLLSLHCLPQKDVLLTVLVDILEEVDSGLVFTAPLLLA